MASDISNMRIGELLKSEGLLTDEQVDVAMAQQAVTGDLLGETLVKMGFVTPEDLAHALARQSGLEFINLEDYPISEDALRVVPKEMAETLNFIPISMENDVLSIGIVNTTNLKAIDFVTKLIGRPPKVYVVDSESFHNTMEQVYYFMEHPIKENIEKIVNESKRRTSADGLNTPRLVELLIHDGIRRNATDIHISPTEEAIHVFYRIDGVLQHAYCLPSICQTGIASRIKVISELDIAEHRVPQDGSFSFTFLKRKYEIRVSFVPTVFGENVVLRVLGGGRALCSLVGLGFDKDDVQRIRRLFNKPYGLLIVAGPTGSGKTTTLYSAMRELNLLEKNIITVEDPVEYKLAMTRQTSVSEKTGYDFARAGRSFMRQDPDVILLGEVRDEETASMAVRASITGHLVLSTLHANSSVAVVPRLLDLNVDRFLLSTAILAVISQRLVRKICPKCKKSFAPDSDFFAKLGLDDIDEQVSVAWKGEGCKDCNGSGYMGRTVVGELLVATDEIREMIYSSASITAIGKIAERDGMVPMRRRGIRLAVEGMTTFEEIKRVLG